MEGTLNDGVKTAKRNGYGLYKRLDSGQNYSYGIDAGDECYILTEGNGWYQLLYPITGQKYGRIAWMTEAMYNHAFNDPPVITSLTNIPGKSSQETISAGEQQQQA